MSEDFTAPSLEAQIVTQVEFYFSDENLPGDKFLQKHMREGADRMVPLIEVVRFKKTRKMLRKILGDDISVNAQCEMLSQYLRSLSTKVVVSDDGLRLGRTVPLPETTDNSEILMRTVHVQLLPAGSTIAQVKEKFSAAGEVCTVRMPNDGSVVRGGPSFAEVEYAEVEGAFTAVDMLTDKNNWRGGQRVTLSNNMTVAAARKHLTKKNKETSQESAKKLGADAADAAVGEKSPDTFTASTGAGVGSEGGVEAVVANGSEVDPVEGIPHGSRLTGKVHSMKGAFGFIAPDQLSGRKSTRHDNLYFATAGIQHELQKGDAVSYDSVIRAGKPNAVNIQVADGGNHRKSKVLITSKAAEAIVEEVTFTRPVLLRMLPAKQLRMARGPDGSLGFEPGHRRATNTPAPPYV